MTAVIICGGKIENYGYMKKYFKDARLIISADSGARHCKSFQVMPDLMVGDFDSVSGVDFADFASAGVEIIRFPAEKDMTDSELAIEIALERGCSRIILLGALGTRLDHSVSNLFLLKKLLDKGIDAAIIDEQNEVKLISHSIVLTREEETFITLLPLAGSAKGVTTSGLYYPLENATLEVGSSRGVSNRFSEDVAQVTVKEGYLLVIKARD
jgi:thiamine pyrophosphokinase